MYIIIGAAGALFGVTALLMYQQYSVGKITEANQKIGIDPPETTSTKVTRELEKLREALEQKGGGLGELGELRGLRELKETRKLQLEELQLILTNQNDMYF